MKKIKNIFEILIAQSLTVVVVLLVVALVGQTYTFLNPSYENIDVIPDRQLGWRLVPNSIFTYTGVHWYKNEFKTQIKTNSLGFRDTERTIKKQKDSTRMVVLGDSFVVAREVPFDKTPSQLLERYLNESNSNESSASSKFEVLNFGITGFGLTQNFLTNRLYVKNYSPEYVFLFIFEETLWRTLSISHAITNTMNMNKKLHIRPILNMNESNIQSLLQVLNFKEFHQFLVKLKNKKIGLQEHETISEKEYVDFIESQRSLVTFDKVIKISNMLAKMKLYLFTADDFEKFISLQNASIKSSFNGQRTRKRKQNFFILDLGSRLLLGFENLRKNIQPELKMQDEIEKLINVYGPLQSEGLGEKSLFEGSKDFPNFETMVFINLKAIQAMKQDVNAYGGQLVIVDATSNVIGKGKLPANLLSTILERYSKVNNIGYIPLYQDLNIANSKGLTTQWPFDSHLNEFGNKVFAESMFRWLQNKGIGVPLSN